MNHIIEAVPNFSCGNDTAIIDAIVSAADSLCDRPADTAAYVLHVDRGVAANRTVVTIAGAPEAVCEAAFRATATAAQLIDMRRHSGEHPRIGATDVLPLIPISADVTLEQCATMAAALGRRIGSELGIPVYLYEAAANGRHLEACRRGEWEGLRSKMTDPEWRPNFGPTTYSDAVARSGAAVVGARGFLGALNFNLSTRDPQIARDIARQVRTASALPTSLPALKAIGWYIAEYGFAQVSTNLVDMNRTSIFDAHRAISAAALERGVKVTGTELIGMLPLWALTTEGNTPEQAVQLLGLDTMREQGRTFVLNEKVIELALSNIKNRH